MVYLLYSLVDWSDLDINQGVLLSAKRDVAICWCRRESQKVIAADIPPISRFGLAVAIDWQWLSRRWSKRLVLSHADGRLLVLIAADRSSLPA
jgi:hypothetical protein